jgi:hypothetical protein
LRLVGVRTIVLLEYLVLAAAVAATVWALLARYQQPTECVDTCFFPVYVLAWGMLAVLLLCVAAVAALVIATVDERRRARRGLGSPRGRDAMRPGTVVAAAGLLVAVLGAVLCWAAAVVHTLI